MEKISSFAQRCWILATSRDPGDTKGNWRREQMILSDSISKKSRK